MFLFKTIRKDPRVSEPIYISEKTGTCIKPEVIHKALSCAQVLKKQSAS